MGQVPGGGRGDRAPPVFLARGGGPRATPTASYPAAVVRFFFDFGLDGDGGSSPVAPLFIRALASST